MTFSRKIFFFLIVGLAGAGAYRGGDRAMEFIQSKMENSPRIAKKIAPVKPRIFWKNNNADRERKDQKHFTFFEVLNDSSMNKFVGLNGEVIVNKEVSGEASASATAPPKKPGEPRQFVQAGKTREARKVSLSSHPEPVPDRVRPHQQFAVQVSSFRNLVRAEALGRRLAYKGYPTFVMKTELGEYRGIWYRVYIGEYPDHESAREAALRIRKDEKLTTMVVRRNPEPGKSNPEPGRRDPGPAKMTEQMASLENPPEGWEP